MKINVEIEKENLTKLKKKKVETEKLFTKSFNLIAYHKYFFCEGQSCSVFHGFVKIIYPYFVLF